MKWIVIQSFAHKWLNGMKIFNEGEIVTITSEEDCKQIIERGFIVQIYDDKYYVGAMDWQDNGRS